MDLPIEDVQSYPRPPALEPVPQRVQVMFAGATIVDTSRAYRVLETHHAPTYYMPPDAIAADLRPVLGGSLCEWKGRARYYDVASAGQIARRAAWAYDAPTPAFAPLAGYVAFYAGHMDACFVGDVRVQPQEGDFYGGWVTPNLTGIVKGAPGTEFW